ncbi:hypothetical protein BCR34DRAFT_533481 [Clohesyomyces aquaticus]|uniref:Peptidase M20 dimerisation domain-containing protein n=1 Tax=Clohesyomyces aquaticus TaxID=1231657 RepID=A0A1Y1ZY83_9PLEO|nr:hypothetical protein BCR34DRAFT_533481 [Clohesyomyces aquaticus]
MSSEKSELVASLLARTLKEWNRPKPSRWSPFYSTYKALHMNPGLSGEEDYAANAIFDEMNKIKDLLETGSGEFRGSFNIFRNFGKNDDEDNPCGPSVVAVLRNWGDLETHEPGPVVLLRADTDALPVSEDNDIDYASQVKDTMHACGHDMHIATLLAAVRLLVGIKDHWTGTLIACFQPCEETGTGALSMVEGGLYDKPDDVPTPNFVFGGHVTPERAGSVSLTHGTAYSRSDSWKITMKGKGGHSSRPEACIDPVVMAAYAITRLQTVVSRVVPSTSAGVLTVGAIHAGKAPNIIPGEAYFTVNIRADSNGLATRMKDEMDSIVRAEVQASYGGTGIDPEEDNPLFEPLLYAPILYNEEPIATDIATVFSAVFGSEFKDFVPGVSGSEDFPFLANVHVEDPERHIPYCYWRFGGTDQKLFDDNHGDVNKLPSNHNKAYLPQCKLEVDGDPLKAGTKAMCAAALSQFRLVSTDQTGSN